MKAGNPFKPGDRVVLSVGMYLGKIGHDALGRLKDGDIYTIASISGNYVKLTGYEDLAGGGIHWSSFKLLEPAKD